MPRAATNALVEAAEQLLLAEELILAVGHNSCMSVAYRPNREPGILRAKTDNHHCKRPKMPDGGENLLIIVAVPL